MATNRRGKKTVMLGVNMPKKMADDLQERASSMHLSLSKYCTLILNDWIASGNLLKIEEQ